MSLIAPAVLAKSEADFARQIKNVAPFAERIQIDLMDGDFASPASIDLESAWWPQSIKADLHLMYKDPEEHIAKIIELRPNLAIIHAEVLVHHMHFAARLHGEGIKAGLALLPETEIADIEQILHSFDHLMIFSGNLGHYGGSADIRLLRKAKEAKEHHPHIEIGWDGGIDDKNAKKIAEGGVDVLNSGGFIQKAEDPSKAYELLHSAIS